MDDDRYVTSDFFTINLSRISLFVPLQAKKERKEKKAPKVKKVTSVSTVKPPELSLNANIFMLF